MGKSYFALCIESLTELLIKSNFRRETIKLGFSSYLFPISLTSFVINNCEVGIEKLENGNLTEYKARLRNCEYQEAHERYFMFDLRYNSGDNVQMNHLIRTNLLSSVIASIRNTPRLTMEAKKRLYTTPF